MCGCPFHFTFAEMLAAGTNCGRIAMWRMVRTGGNKADYSAQWKLQTPTEIQGNVTQLEVKNEYIMKI